MGTIEPATTRRTAATSFPLPAVAGLVIGLVVGIMIGRASVPKPSPPPVPLGGGLVGAVPDLSREAAKRSLEANKPAILAADLRASGMNPVDPDVASSVFNVEPIQVSGISKTSAAVAIAAFATEITMRRTGAKSPFVGEATFRLFDDGWRLEPTSITKN
jgi:hypothetical protein